MHQARRQAELTSIALCSVLASIGGCAKAPQGMQSVTLSWTAPTKSTDGTPIGEISGYRVYAGTDPDKLFLRGGVTGAESTHYVVTGLDSGTYYFAVSAYTAAGLESERTAVIKKVL